MTRDSLDAFVRRDADLARSVLTRDDEVDQLKDQVFRELLTYMMADPGTIQRALALILISRNLERIADHATNIAEDVIFLVEAKDGDITTRRRRTRLRADERGGSRAASAPAPPQPDTRRRVVLIEDDGTSPKPSHTSSRRSACR
jgi:phosphate uptake regulator